MRPLARRVSFGFFLLSLAAAETSPLFGQDAGKAHVAVVQFSNATGSDSYDVACSAATDTLVLTLRELGRYIVEPGETLAPGGGDEGLHDVAEERNLDFVLYGRMSTPESGGIRCSLSVYDRAKGKTTLTRSQKATGVLDIFDATDRLVVSVLESMTGGHIGFGTVSLENAGEEGSYEVLVDGSSIGRDLKSLDRMPMGQHLVVIAQKRMLGDREIASSSVEVKEGETTELGFSIPYLMDDEKRKAEDLRAAIQAGWDDASAAGDVDAKIAEFASLFGDVSYSPKLSAYRDEARQLGGEWALQKNRLDIEGSAWAPKAELLDAAGTIYADAKSYPDEGMIRAAFEENARLLTTLLGLAAGNSLGDGDLGRGLTYLQDAFRLSTRYPEGGQANDYAYAAATLKDIQDKVSRQGASGKDDRNVETVFGALMRAGKRFFDLRTQVEAGKVCALVASDWATMVSVDGSGFADVPMALPPIQGQRSMSVQVKTAASPVSLAAGLGTRLLFVQDGFAAFGKVEPEVVAAAASVSGGRIVLPWVPSGAKVILGRYPSLELANESKSGFRSSLVAPGEYAIAVGTYYDGSVTVTPGGEVEPADYRSAMEARLDAASEALTNKLVSKRKRTRAGWISLATGILGGAGAGVVYYLGQQAMDSYNAQTTTASAGSAWNTVSLYETLFAAAALVGGVGLGLSPILLATGPDPRTLQRSIEDLDEGIRALQKQE